MNKFLGKFVSLIAIAALLVWVDVNAMESRSDYVLKGNGLEGYMIQSDPCWELMKKPVKVKGIYMTGNTVANNARFGSLIDLISRTELNAVVIDVKDDEGLVTYSTNITSARHTGANDRILIKDMDKVLKLLNEKNIYPIARIVTFKDKKAGTMLPKFAVKNKDGSVWKDRGGMPWLNPYIKESWNYVLSIAEEAVIKGFKEIQFDYVRFPTDGNLDNIDYGVDTSRNTKADTIANFLSYANKRLTSMGACVSADVFGLVTTSIDDMRIGQHLESIAKSTDVICPMVYPSHYGRGNYGILHPDFEPYKVVNYSMKIAKDRIDTLNYGGKKAVLRPWLQDFTAKYLDNYKVYGSKEVRAQINATYDAGVEEWILWNAGNYYTEGALY